MREKKFVISDYTTAEEIKKVRKSLGLTQREFAVLLNVSKPTVERWERSNEPINGPIVLLLDMISKNPDYITSITVPEKRMPLRLYYMHGAKICTIIDVDELKREVKITNYADNIMFRAFGVIEKPTFEDYLEFLESRCFPRTRDKMKLILQDLNLPFYDPFLIIEKTEGRMAEDDFWIRIER